MTAWFAATQVAPGVTCLTEPSVHGFYRANIFHLSGRDADLVVDFGCGLSPLRPALPVTGRPVIAVATHAHVDHVGGFHEFADRRGPSVEAHHFAAMDEPGTLQGTLRAIPGAVARPPASGFDLSRWSLVPALLTTALKDGDTIDLGDRRFTCLHLPGHSPGSMGLLDQDAGLFFTGDAIYDDTLVDDVPGSDVAAYLATMERLRHLDLSLALGGHGLPFGQARLRTIAEDYLRSRNL
jgi:glyoxylase-like metal-dependent hydrolase (beta-lactamase superfamily II)